VSVELRPPRLEDAAGISRMSDEFSRSAGGDPLSPAEAETWLGTPSLDLDLDARVVVAGKEIAGFADVFDPAGTGEALWCDVRAAALCEALESRGWAFERFSLRMLADFGDDLPEPDWPEGIDVRTFRKGEDGRAVYEVQQETFSDLDNLAPLTFEVWKRFAFEEPFHPELWFLAEEEGELQGISLCAAGRGGDRELGWFAVLAVRRPWRGRGLGLALLRHSFRELRERGLKRVGLGVDRENATGAVRLHERAGMEVERRRLLYARHAS